MTNGDPAKPIRRHTAWSKGNMDQYPQNNQPSGTGDYKPHYHWLSPLRDIQPQIFNPEMVPNLEDNPISGIDTDLFTERATNTSEETGSSTHVGYLYQGIPTNNQIFTWPTMSASGGNHSICPSSATTITTTSYFDTKQ